jgi:hypothetical protein
MGYRRHGGAAGAGDTPSGSRGDRLRCRRPRDRASAAGSRLRGRHLCQGRPPDTTSNVAAALFGVTSLVDDADRSAEIVDRLRQAARFAHRYFQNFVGDRYGVRWIDFFLIGEEPQEQPWDFAITPELYPLTVIAPADNSFPTRYASRFPTMFIETNVYLPSLSSVPPIVQLLHDFRLSPRWKSLWAKCDVYQDTHGPLRRMSR